MALTQHNAGRRWNMPTRHSTSHGPGPYKSAVDARKAMRILLIQRDAILAGSIVSSLEQRHFIVEWTDNGISAEKLLSLHDFDALVTDVDVPGKDGHALMLQIKMAGSELPVLILTAENSESEKLACFREGADDFISIPVNLPELEARLLAIIRRSRNARKPSLRCGPLEFDPHVRIFQLGGEPLHLSPREHALLFALIQKTGQVVTKQGLFDQVFGKDDDTSIKTIEVVVWRLRKRLAATAVHIVNMRGFGYRLVHEADSSFAASSAGPALTSPES